MAKLKPQLNSLKSLIKLVFIILIFSEYLFARVGKGDSVKTFKFKWANDFEYQTDYYYTNGFAFELTTPKADINLLNSILLHNGNNDLVISSYTLMQDIFTPKAKFYIPDQLNGDRPFAAYILAGVKKVSFNMHSNTILYSELQIGVIGPMALGEEVQNGIHKMLPTSAEVEGWENQISNDILVNYTASFQKSLLLDNWLNINTKATLKLGLPYTFFNIDIGTQLGIFENLPDEFHFYSHNDFVFYLSLSAGTSMVGYNATLQGGLFSNSVYTITEINRILGHAKIGVTFVHKTLMLKYVQTFITPEFHGALYHSWGTLSIEVKL